VVLHCRIVALSSAMPMQPEPAPEAPSTVAPVAAGQTPASPTAPREVGGREGPEPTRFGDWEKSGRCIDF
jgi:hypothetical protein